MVIPRIGGLGGGSLGSLVVNIGADLKDLNRGLASATTKTEASSKRMAAAASIASKAFLGIGLAAIAGATLAVKAAIDFESAFAGVRKTVDATEEEFAQLSDNFLNLSKTIPISANELSKIGELAGQLGVQGVAELTKFTETIAKIAVTTNLTQESAATDFARIANIMQVPIEQVDRMGATVVDLGNNAATTEAEIVSFANRIAAAGRTVGLSTADVLAFGAAFSSVGVRAERGGTAVNKALIQIATAIENGGQQLETFAEIAGVTSEEFARGFREDAALAFATFIEGLGEAGIKGANVLKELELGDQRLIQAFLSVGGAGGLLTESVKRGNEAWEENIALNEEAAKRFATTASQIKILGNNINVLGIEAGTVLLPTINQIVIGLISFVNSLRNVAIAFNILRSGAAEVTENILAGLKAILFTLSLIGEGLTRLPFGEKFQEGADDISELLESVENLRAGFQLVGEETAAAALKIRQEMGATSEELIAQHKRFTDALNKVSSDAAKKRAKTSGEILNEQLTRLASILQQQGEHNKAAAIAFKAIQLGRSIINTSEAITEALPNIPLAALIAAIGAAEIATIVGTGFQAGTDEIPARVSPGEMIIPSTFADAIRTGRLVLAGPGVLGEGGGIPTIAPQRSITFENIEINVAGDLDEDAIPEIIEQIGIRTENESRGA